MTGKMENPATLATCGAPKSDLAGASIGSEIMPLSREEQGVLDRIDYIVRDLDPETWSTVGLRKLSEAAAAVRSKADVERYRRIPPSEVGPGLLGLLGKLDRASAEGDAA